ncbi:MAG: T9SS type A sorting domain-containing protein, partial [Bacteroidales bacterium]|nr:T9SS type A sorting domain-containing protein [Bacteroidales bacterium]
NNVQILGLYPNPATEILNIQANDVKNIEIVNILGQTVITTNVQTINVANLTNGVYFVRVNFNSGTVSTQKFVKE